MGLKTFTTNFQNIGEQEFLRPNVGYRYFFDVQKAEIYPSQKQIKLGQILEMVSTKKISKGELESEESLVDIGNIERRFNCLINIKKTSIIGSDKNILQEGDIIIPKIQPQMGNIYLNLEHKRFIASTELMEYSISDKYNPIFLYYLITSKIFLSNLAKLEGGKTHRRVNPIDLYKIKIPVIEKTQQDKVAIQIKPIEKKMRESNSQIVPVQEAINKIFAREFGFDLEKVRKVDDDNRFYCDFSQLAPKNSNIRFSYRWNQLGRVQEELYRNNKEIRTLGDFIISTKNGWSPECNDDENGQAVLGIDAIQKMGKLDLSNPKFTQQARGNIADFIIKSGDFLVSRGNTIDLVALASVAEIQEDLQDCIYPDLMIKVEFDEKQIDKEYMAFLFNSVIGRTYFKYSAKGKNQTMVKISAKELYDFRLPIPDKGLQQKMVREIKIEIEKQECIRKKIMAERNKIDEIIERTIASNSIF